MYELVILPKEWLFADENPRRFEVLTKVVNKAYSKPMAKFGLIESPRIRAMDSFLKDLRMKAGSECFITLLLGSSDVFDKIRAETGYSRKFDYELFPLTNFNTSDIPREYRQYFEPLTPDTSVKVTVAGPSTVIDDGIADRLLGVCGYKNIPGELDNVKEYELVSFASFLGGIGPRLLEYTIAKYLADLQLEFADQSKVSKCIIHAVVIKDHELVPYYTERCQFASSGKPDLLIKNSGDDAPLDVIATREFHLAFLQREVAVTSTV